MNFSISIRSIFALIAYALCFTASYFLLWDDQMRLSHFHIDPFQSKITRFLVKSVMWNMRDEARLFGVILAFASIHLSWSCRYFVGDRLMAAYARHQQKSSSTLTPDDTIFTAAPPSARADGKISNDIQPKVQDKSSD